MALRPFSSFGRRTARLLGLCLLAAPAVIATDLREKSPFLPAGFNRPSELPNTAPPPQATVAPSNLSLRGVFSISGVYRFNIFDKTQNQGTWVTENDPASGYQVHSFDLRTSTLQIEVGGQTFALALERPDHSPTPVAGVPTPTPTAQQQPQQPTTRPADGSAPPRRVVVPPRRVTTPQNPGSRTPPPPPPPTNR